LHFFKNTFGKNFTLELNSEEAYTLFSILEFVHRESSGRGTLLGIVSPQETVLADKVHKEIQPYLEEWEYEVK
jgi:hypothetical protein